MFSVPVLSPNKTGTALRFLSFLLLALFTLQTAGIPPLAAQKNSKTCCGRIVCLCKHSVGAQCDFRKKRGESLSEAKTASAFMGHHSCHLKKDQTAKVTKTAEENKTESAFNFTKAPCASDTPSSVLPSGIKPFILKSSGNRCDISPSVFYGSNFPRSSGSLFAKGIERPPRVLLFSI